MRLKKIIIFFLSKKKEKLFLALTTTVAFYVNADISRGKRNVLNFTF